MNITGNYPKLLDYLQYFGVEERGLKEGFGLSMKEQDRRSLEIVHREFHSENTGQMSVLTPWGYCKESA